MSFRELSMIEIREVLRRWTAGQAVGAVARETGVDRKTVDRYVNAARESGMARGSELSDAIVTAVSQRVQGRPLPASSEQWKQLEAQRARIEQWLKSDRPLRLVRVHELLGRDSVLMSHTTLRRFAHREIGWHERPRTVRVDDAPPAEEAQIDFGLMGRLHDADGRLRKLWVLVVTLTASRYTFVWPMFSQTVEVLCDGLDTACGAATSPALASTARLGVYRVRCTGWKSSRITRRPAAGFGVRQPCARAGRRSDRGRDEVFFERRDRRRERLGLVNTAPDHFVYVADERGTAEQAQIDLMQQHAVTVRRGAR